MPAPDFGAFGTVVKYNGITMGLVKTNLISRTAILDDSNTEYLYTRWLIDVTCIYNQDATSYTVNDANAPVATEGVSPANTDSAIRSILVQPQAQLTISVGPDTLFASPLPDMKLDCNNGPFVKKCDIRRITGTTTFHVDFAIETFMVECPFFPSAPTLISNRWAITDQVDCMTLLTTKVIRGLAIFRTDLLANAGKCPDDFRDQVLPPVPLGFQRVKIVASMSPAQNSLAYEVVDQEQVVHIGNQATTNGVQHFEAKYIVGTPESEGGAATPMTIATCIVTVIGMRDTSNWFLFLWAVRVAYQKLQLDGTLIPIPVLRNVTVETRLDQRRVDLSITVQKAPANQANQVSILDMLQLQNDNLAVFNNLGIDPQPLDQATRGAYTYTMLAKDFQNACDKQMMPASSTVNPPAPTSQNNDQNQPTSSVSLSDQYPFSNENVYSTKVFSDYRVDVRYETDQNTVMCPVAGGAYGESQSSTYTLGGPNTGYPQVPVSASFMQVAAPTTKKVIVLTGEKLGAPPTMPNPTPTDNNLVLLNHHYQACVPEPMPDGSTPVYRMVATYWYGMKNPMKPGDSLQTGSVPWATLNFSQGSYDDWDEDGEILDLTAQNQSPGLGGDN